jgi:hypothetical protein
MKKQNLLITSALASVLACPAFATGSGIGASAQSADCDNGVLGTYTGPASLSANWTANTIHLDFYDGEEKLSSGQCTYDGGIVLPEDPTKPGYEFDGWKVRRAPAAPAQCSLLGIDTSISPIEIDYTLDGDFVLPESGPFGEWEAVFSYGTVKGISMMSSVYAEFGEIRDPYSGSTSSNSHNCWCKATEFTPTNGSTCSLPNDMPWVFVQDLVEYGIQPELCPEICAESLDYSDRRFRINIFGQSN